MTQTINRACPVVLRNHNNQLQLLVFRHPKGKTQLVKGKFKKGEHLAQACVRELEEESGIQAQAVRELGSWDSGFKNQIWGFCLMHYENILPDAWEFATKDDNGQLFSFFWQPLDSPLDDNWNEVYKNAFEYIKNALDK